MQKRLKMKREHGLHKKISSIFGDVPLPGKSSPLSSLAGNSPRTKNSIVSKADNNIVPLRKEPKKSIQLISLAGNGSRTKKVVVPKANNNISPLRKEPKKLIQLISLADNSPSAKNSVVSNADNNIAPLGKEPKKSIQLSSLAGNRLSAKNSVVPKADNNIVPLRKEPKKPVQKKSPQADRPSLSQFSYTAPSPEDAYEAEFRKSQKRKAILMCALAIVFVGVIYVLYFNPSGKTVAKATTTQQEAQSVAKVNKASEVAWQAPEPWPKDIRDPMVFVDNGKENLYAIGVFNGPVLKGIVYRPNGKSSVLIGKDVLYVGEQTQGWKVVDILSNMVRLEKDSGEKLELKTKNR